MNLLFVYGTLKKGHIRNAALERERYIGTARTIDKYAMFTVSTYPGLVESNQNCAGKKILGELYEVGDECIQLLDGIEGVDFGLFKREEIILEDYTVVNLPLSADAFAKLHVKIAQAYIYLKDISECKDAGIFWPTR